MFASSKESFEMDNAKIEIRNGSMSLSAEGSEPFVRDALSFWEKMLKAPAMPVAKSGEIEDKGSSPATTVEANNKSISRGIPSGIAQYENVYDSVDDKLKIIAHVPGKNKAEQTRSVALIVMYGHLLQGMEQVPSDAIRQACVDQGCYDQANFAQYLKSLKSRVVMNTKAGGGYDVKLTAPGRKDAKELVQSLNGESA